MRACNASLNGRIVHGCIGQCIQMNCVIITSLFFRIVSCLPTDLWQRSSVCSNYRTATSHGLENGQPKALIVRRHATFHTSYYRLPRGRVSRYVVSAYDFTYERYREGLARFVHTTQKLASLRRADAVLCISHSTKRDVLEFCRGIDAAKLHVTHLGVDNDTFFRDVGPGLGEEATVLFVGQRGGYKRFDLAVDALRQCPRLRLGVVGPPLERTERDMLRATLGARWQEFGPVRRRN